MKCKYCQGELEQGQTLCPHCGKDNTPEQTPVQPGMDKTRLVLTICAIGAVALLGIGLIAITLFGIRGGWQSQENTTPVATTTAPETTPAPTEYVPGEGVLQFQSYSVSDEDALSKAQTLVATVGEVQLVNRQLQMYYWMGFYDVWGYFYNQYGEYTPYYIGLDYTKPMKDQSIPDGSRNWDQYLLENALNTWHRYQVLGKLAKAEGYIVTNEIRQELDDTRASMEATAKEKGVDVNDLIADEMGAGVTIEDYLGYLELYLLGMDYFNDLYDNVEITPDRLNEYYEANKETFAVSGITRESGNIGNVRHILIMPEGGTTVEGSPYKSYTEDEWAACLAEAQTVLDLWKSGEATEESFIEMTGKYTQDTGYAQNGGLYTDVYVGSGYVEAFESWVSDPARKSGDCELVKTEYGYHIMYLIDSQVCWEYFATQGCKSEYCTEVIDQAVEENPMEVTYENIALAVVNLGGE